MWWLNGVAPYEGNVGWPEPVWMNMLIHLTLNQPQCQAAFNGRICRYLASDWWNEELPRLVAATAETIRPAVAQDPNDLVTSSNLSQFDDTVAELLGFLQDRRAYLEQQLGCP